MYFWAVLMAASVPMSAATVDRRGDAALFDSQFWPLETAPAPVREEAGFAAAAKPAAALDRFQFATILLPESSAAMALGNHPRQSAELSRRLLRPHPVRAGGRTGGVLASESIPERERELMLTVGGLLILASVALAWLVRDSAPYSSPGGNLRRGESPHMPALVFSTHAGYQSLSHLADAVERRTPRRGPGSAAPEVRSRAAAVGGR
jgi:hypothetical protein